MSDDTSAPSMASPTHYPIWVGPGGESTISDRVVFTFIVAYLGAFCINGPAMFVLETSWPVLPTLGLPIVLASTVPFWHRHRFLSRTIGAVAVDLAELGLFRGREGRKRARVMKEYDKRARELNLVISELNAAEEDLAADPNAEPLLLAEMEARRKALEEERAALFEQAQKRYQVQREQAARARAACDAKRQESAATSNAFAALAAARRATYGLDRRPEPGTPVLQGSRVPGPATGQSPGTEAGAEGAGLDCSQRR